MSLAGTVFRLAVILLFVSLAAVSYSLLAANQVEDHHAGTTIVHVSGQ